MYKSREVIIWQQELKEELKKEKQKEKEQKVQKIWEGCLIENTTTFKIKIKNRKISIDTFLKLHILTPENWKNLKEIV